MDTSTHTAAGGEARELIAAVVKARHRRPARRNDGTLKCARQPAPFYRCRMSSSVVTLHRRATVDLQRSIWRTLHGRYGWNPAGRRIGEQFLAQKEEAA